MINLNQKLSKDPSIVSREIAGEVILVPIRQNVGDLGRIYTLNETAAFVWLSIDGSVTLAEIRDQIISKYDIAEGEAEEDILELVNQLTEIGAVRIA